MRSSADVGEYDSHENDLPFSKKMSKLSNKLGNKNFKSKHKSSHLEETKYYSGIFQSGDQIKEELSENRSDEGGTDLNYSRRKGMTGKAHLSGSSSASSVFKSSDGGSTYF